MNKTNTLSYTVKILITVIFACIFTFMAILNIQIAFLISAAFLFLILVLLLFVKIDEKTFFIVFFFVYPLLPGLWGINLPSGLPVIRAHRVAILILILYLLRNGLLLKYYFNFFKARLFNYSLLFMTLSFVTTSLFSVDTGATFFFTLSFIFESLILAVAVYNAFPKREDIESLISTLCFSAFILCVLGLIEKYTEYNFYTIFGSYISEMDLEHVIRDGSVRVNASFGHPISFGAYLAMILPIVLYKYRNTLSKFYASFGLILLSINATQSRSGQIGAGIVIIFYFIFIERIKIGMLFIFSIPLLVIFSKRILAFLRELNPLTSTDPDLISSSSMRMEQIKFYSNFIKERLIFGHGLNQAPPMMLGNYDGSEGNYVFSIDNYYLGHTFNFGIVGLITWLYFMFDVILKPVRYYGKKFFEDKLVLSIILGFIIFDVINIIVLLFHFHFVFWIYLGIISRLLVIKKNELLNIKL